MIPETLHVISGFMSHVLKKRFISRIKAASEHEILPDKNPHFVAKIIEIVTLVDAATPNAEHVHVGVAHGPEQFAISIFADAAPERHRPGPGAAFCKDKHDIHHKRKTFSR